MPNIQALLESGLSMLGFDKLSAKKTGTSLGSTITDAFQESLQGCWKAGGEIVRREDEKQDEAADNEGY